MADMKDWSSLSKADPEWEKHVQEKMGGHPPDIGMFPDIASLRTWMANSKQAMTAELGPKILGVKEADHQAATRDGSKIVCRVYQPEIPPSEGSPLFVVYHGGGWCIGGLENEELLCRLLCSKLGATCVNVDYRLGPEHKFPTAIDDCHDAAKWAAENASSFGADPSKGFIVAGTSAGGNMTLTVAHLLRDEGFRPNITGLHMMVPAMCYFAYIPEKYRHECKSWVENANAPILSHKAIQLFLDNYIPNEADRKDPKYSPWLFQTGHKGLPPSYFQVCGADPLRDEALVYERVMREDGIKTKVDIYPGLPHGFWSVVPGLKSSQKFVQDSVKGAQWLLEQK